MRTVTRFGLASALVVLASVSASATIVSGNVTGGSAFTAGGVFVKLTVPLSNPFGPANSVGQDNYQSNNLFGFDESQNILLTSALTVDVGTSPIAAGTRVASHYVFFDPSNPQNIQGHVNFDSKVLGIITSTGLLIASDFLAHTGVNYLSPSARGLEAGDSVTISGLNQIFFDTSASSPGDYVRVITAFSPAAAVPEPSTLAIAFTGLAASAAAAMRRRRSR